MEPLCLAANLAISSGYCLKNVSQQQCTPFSTKKFSRLAVSHHESTIFVLHYHELTTNCSMIIYLSHITLRHLSTHRLLLSSHTHIPAMTINRWNSTQRTMTKNSTPTCLPFQLRKGIWKLQLQCQAANILRGEVSLSRTVSPSTARPRMILSFRCLLIETVLIMIRVSSVTSH